MGVKLARSLFIGIHLQYINISMSRHVMTMDILIYFRLSKRFILIYNIEIWVGDCEPDYTSSKL